MKRFIGRISLVWTLMALFGVASGLWPTSATARGGSLRDQLRRLDWLYEGYPGSLSGMGDDSRSKSSVVIRDTPWPIASAVDLDSRRNAAFLSFLLASGQSEEANEFLESLSREARTHPQIMMLEADLLRRTERLDDALALCRRIVAQSPDDFAPLLLMSSIQTAKRDLKGSIESLEKARTLSSHNRQVLEALEKCYREQLGRSKDLKESQLVLDKMEQVYLDIVEILPGQRGAPYLVVLARILERRGEGREALGCMEKVALYRPRDVENLLSLAQYQEKYDPDRKAPLKTLRRALVVDPGFPELDRAISRAIVHSGEPTSLHDFYESAAEEYPGRDDIQQGYAEILLAESKPDEAIDVLKASLTLHPYNHNVDRYVLLVDAATRQGRLQEATPFLEKAVGNMFNEQRRFLSGFLVSVYEQTDQTDKAVELLNEMIDKDPQDAGIRITLAGLYQRKGETQRAEAIADAVVSGDVRDPITFYDVGLLKWDLGRHDQAEKYLARAIDLNPEFADAYNSLGYLFAEQGIKLDQALELVQKAMKMKPDQGYITDSLGWVYFKKGEIDKAVEYLSAAARLEQTDPTIREHLAEAYLAKGNDDRALSEFKKALELSTDKSQTEEIQRRIETLAMPR
ncbi:tetratricopeptide repeat protein [Candidatus Sumerlaeota bacterium]|nr:tetratricopeptide repeat protein [Candidatus Sumerlaeota bacterium]